MDYEAEIKLSGLMGLLQPLLGRAFDSIAKGAVAGMKRELDALARRPRSAAVRRRRMDARESSSTTPLSLSIVGSFSRLGYHVAPPPLSAGRMRRPGSLAGQTVLDHRADVRPGTCDSR